MSNKTAKLAIAILYYQLANNRDTHTIELMTVVVETDPNKTIQRHDAPPDNIDLFLDP